MDGEALVWAKVIVSQESMLVQRSMRNCGTRRANVMPEIFRSNTQLGLRNRTCLLRVEVFQLRQLSNVQPSIVVIISGEQCSL